MTVVVFGAEKGGVGKTSLSLGFTTLAAGAGADVVLLDTDRQKTASNWLELRMEDSSLPPVSVLANSADPLRQIESLSRRYDLVVVDIGAQNYKALVECAVLADMYLIPTSTSALDLDTTEDLYGLLRKVRPQVKKQPAAIWTVLTKVPVHPSSREVARTKERLGEHDIPVFEAVLPARSAWRSMANTGRALHELTGKDRDEKACTEMQAFYAEVIQNLKRINRVKEG